MNEHDSERIAGLLEGDGYVAVADEADADVVVLNTCCIRENADNKLYGTLGWLKPWKELREGRQIVVAGCLAQKDAISFARRLRMSTLSWGRTTCIAPPTSSIRHASVARSPKS